MNWDGPVLTDSGGFQIFSLPHERAMNEEGARFKSYVDGKSYLLSPESSIEMQKAIGSDIMMVLDHCIPSTAPHAEAEAAMHLTHRWAERSLRARGDSAQALFGIVQGACHHDLREQSALFLSELPFDGLAIGGLAVGETHQERYAMTGHVIGSSSGAFAALSHGRGHADRSAGIRSSRRRHVRLHHPLPTRAARRRFHLSGEDSAAPIRA